MLDTMTAPARVMTDPGEIAIFALAGNAILTLRSTASGAHYTYRVRRSQDGKLHFVSALAGPDEEYVYLGIVAPDPNGPRFRRTAKSRFGDDAPAFKAFNWFFRKVIAQRTLPTALEVRHEGRCGCCGRRLTHPESIDRGIGPECAAKLGLA